jgi:hypothetical protein
MIVCSVLAPLPLRVRVLGLAVMGTYLLLSAWLGSCLGDRLPPNGSGRCQLR